MHIVFRFILGTFFMITPIQATLTPVEQAFLDRSARPARFEGEKISIIETSNVCELGKLTALAFIEWVLENPDGVIALPTGKTPEYFIEYIKHYQKNWNEPNVQKELRSYHILHPHFPDTSQLRFVQLDEFYPMNPEQVNSFSHYIKEHYLSWLNLKPENILAIDISNRGILKQKGMEKVFPKGKVGFASQNRDQKIALEEVSRFCEEYEKKITEWGGIGFFLGGIGPDGHIAFNMSGDSFDSTTRLVQLNYPSAAAAAGDLGGIEFSRDKTAITIGLKTITQNPNARIIIMAAGEAKAPIIAKTVEQSQNEVYPGSLLQSHSGARFYLTKGASKKLYARQLEDLSSMELTPQLIDEIVIDLALRKKKGLLELSENDFQSDSKGAIFLKRVAQPVSSIVNRVRARLIAKIDRGLESPQNINILHTAPHHDDVMLSYHPFLHSVLKQNRNQFLYLTSGFNSVTDSYFLETIKIHPLIEIEHSQKEIFSTPYEQLISRYWKKNDRGRSHIEWLFLMRNIATVYSLHKPAELQERVRWIRDEYFAKKPVGIKDLKEIQLIKGAMRETESDRMLAMLEVPMKDVHHLRAHFYTGDYFNPMPTIEHDAKPVLKFYQEFKPDIITVAFDPEGTGPDTHYKVLQVVAEALRISPEFFQPIVWGYRNVWHRFSYGDANLMRPVSAEEMNILHYAFMESFSTQKSASFPSVNYDGPFSELATQIQREQFNQLVVLLGRDYFLQHPDVRMQEAKGFLFLRAMDRETFLQSARDLRSKVVK